jgi:hypothetical protein
MPGAEFMYAPPQFADGIHRAGKVYRGDPGEPVGIPVDDRRHLVVSDQRAAWPPPGAKHPDVHMSGVHRGYGVLHGDLA